MKLFRKIIIYSVSDSQYIVMYIPLLSDDSVNNDRFWATARKHVPTATNTHATIEFLLRPFRNVIRKEQSSDE
jgi:hypothetical protein